MEASSPQPAHGHGREAITERKRVGPGMKDDASLEPRAELVAEVAQPAKSPLAGVALP